MDKDNNQGKNWWEPGAMPYVCLPRFLIESSTYIELSLEAKMAYALFSDRMRLSSLEENKERFTSENGEIFIVFTNEEICEKLNCSHTKATCVLRELEDKGLIKREKLGHNKADRIFPLRPSLDEKESHSDEGNSVGKHKNAVAQGAETQQSGPQENNSPDCKNNATRDAKGEQYGEQKSDIPECKKAAHNNNEGRDNENKKNNSVKVVEEKAVSEQEIRARIENHFDLQLLRRAVEDKTILNCVVESIVFGCVDAHGPIRLRNDSIKRPCDIRHRVFALSGCELGKAVEAVAAGKIRSDTQSILSALYNKEWS